MSWFDELQPASFRGVPFGVQGGDGQFGRRLAIHQYPFRDDPWVEDLGRKVRRIGLRGFLIEDSVIYGGGSVIAQRAALIKACEAFGPGPLVHPTLGRLTVSVDDFAPSETTEGRYFEFGLGVIDSGTRQFPTVSVSSADAVSSAADAVDAASAASFITRATAALQEGAAVVGQAVSTAQAWIGMAQGLARDATSLVGMVATLPGNFGRYVGGRTLGFATASLPIGSALSTLSAVNAGVSGLIATGAQARALVTRTANDLGDVASRLGL